MAALYSNAGLVAHVGVGVSGQTPRGKLADLLLPLLLLSAVHEHEVRVGVEEDQRLLHLQWCRRVSRPRPLGRCLHVLAGQAHLRCQHETVWLLQIVASVLM